MRIFLGLEQVVPGARRPRACVHGDVIPRADWCARFPPAWPARAPASHRAGCMALPREARAQRQNRSHFELRVGASGRCAKRNIQTQLERTRRSDLRELTAANAREGLGYRLHVLVGRGLEPHVYPGAVAGRTARRPPSRLKSLTAFDLPGDPERGWPLCGIERQGADHVGILGTFGEQTSQAHADQLCQEPSAGRSNPDTTWARLASSVWRCDEK